MRQVALEHGINAGPPVVMVLTGQSDSEMEPWGYGSKILKSQDAFCVEISFKCRKITTGIPLLGTCDYRGPY